MTPRIVLVDTLGEELFSGKSVLSSVPPPQDLDRDEDEEPCPETLRSSVFARVDRASRVERTIEVTEVEIGAA